MKRTLYLARHAKSDWGNAELGDHQRPLNKRGQRDAPRIGAWLAKHHQHPTRAISSDAMRTRQTWGLMCDAWTQAIPVEWIAELYLASPQEMIEVLEQQPNNCTTLLYLGHNPGCEQLASFLGGLSVKMTTANVAILHGEGDTWADALQNRWTLETLLQPKALPKD